MRGVKDSLITFSAVGAAGLLAYYSLSSPSTINEPKNLVKRSFEGFADEAAQSSFLADFCLDTEDCDELEDDVLMFADVDCDKNPDALECNARAGRGKKRKRKPAASNDAPVVADRAANDWLATDVGKAAMQKKVDTAKAQLAKIHRAYQTISPAQLPEDAMQLDLGDGVVSDGTASVLADLENQGRDCGLGANGRISNSKIFAIFPEDIMYDTDADQEALHASYIKFAQKLGEAGGDDVSVGTYAFNNLVNLVKYSSDWNSYYPFFNVPAKKNRQGSYNLGASSPNLFKIIGNTWKKVQKEVKRSMDFQAGSPTCQIFLFVHNIPYEYKSLAGDNWELPSNIASRCNVVPVFISNDDTVEAMTNAAARFSPVHQDWTAVEPLLRGYINAGAPEYVNSVDNVADGLLTWSCLSEERAACRVQRAAWFAPLDEFRGLETTDAPSDYTTAEATTPWFTTTTSWTSTTAETDAVDYGQDEYVVDIRCCGVNGGAGLGAGTYDQEAASCCRNEDGSYSSC